MLVSGSMLQESLLPSWFLKALLLLLAALVALVLIWFLFLRPVIQSTAQERTDAALQQAGITPPSNPGSQPGGGGQPTPTPAARPDERAPRAHTDPGSGRCRDTP